MRLPVIFTSFPRGTSTLRDPLPVPLGLSRRCEGHVADRSVMLALLDDPWGQPGTSWFVDSPRYSYCLDPALRSLQVKVTYDPDLQGRGVEVSLWVEPGVEFRDDLDVVGLASDYLQESDICAFRHPTYDCAYDYAEDLKVKYPSRALEISSQVDRYLREGFPHKRGLLDTSVILRRHTPRMREICTTWWRELILGDHDETLSLSYAMWKHGEARAATFPGLMGDDFAPDVVDPPRKLPPCNPFFRRCP